MEKLIMIFNTLMKHKLITHPKYLLFILLVFGLLNIPKYLNIIVENGVKNVFYEQVNMHNKLIKYRTQISPKIDVVLKNIGKGLNADRAFLGEYSNSTIGLTGLPFLYFTIHNEFPKPGILPIANQYQKQNNSNFKFNSILYAKKTLAIYNIEDIKDTDPLTYYMLKKNNTNQLYLILFSINDEPKGFLGVSYEKSSSFSSDEIFYEMSTALRELEDLFNYENKLK